MQKVPESQHIGFPALFVSGISERRDGKLSSVCAENSFGNFNTGLLQDILKVICRIAA